MEMKRKISAVICAVMLLVSAAACSNSGGKDSSAGEIRLFGHYFNNSKYDSKTYNTYLDCRGSTVYCTEETAKAYPKLAAALEKTADKILQDADQFSSEEDKAAHDFSKEGGTGRYMDTAFSVVKRADEKAVSIETEGYTFSGGAHGMYCYTARNIDPATGEEIALSDVVKDQSKLNELLLKELDARYPEMKITERENLFEAYDMNVTATDLEQFAYTFTLDPDGICFYFSAYDLGSYADGVQMVKLLYSAAPDLFVEDYSVSGGYVSGLVEKGLYDFGGDGTLDEISFSGIEEELNQYYKGVYVEKNGKGMNTDLYSYNMDTFVVHTEDNRDYLYVITHMDNDGSNLLIFDLGGEKPSLVEDTGYGLCLAGLEEKKVYGYELITDTNDFTLTFRCDLLATFTATFNTSVGADGKPVLPEDGYYAVPEYVNTLESAKAFKADIVDESGEVVSKEVEIPAGETFKLIRTDGNTIVDARLSDGRLARLELERGDDSYLATVNGQLSEEEAFKTLYYAG